MPRFTIKRFMVFIAAIGLVLGLLQQHPLPTIMVIYFLALAGLAWSATRVRPGLASRAFLPAAIWLNFSLFASFAYSPLFHKSFLFVGALASVPIASGLGLAWIASKDGRHARVGAASIVVAVLALALSMLSTHWPLRLAFYVSSPALNRLADRAEAGEVLASPEWAGVYRVHSFQPYNSGGEMLLRVNPTRGQKAGFVRRQGSEKGARREGLYYGPAWGDRWNYVDSW